MIIRSQADLVTIGLFLGNVRELDGLSVHAVAKKAGIERSVVQSIEEGGRYRTENLVRYAEAMGLELEVQFHRV